MKKPPLRRFFHVPEKLHGRFVILRVSSRCRTASINPPKESAAMLFTSQSRVSPLVCALLLSVSAVTVQAQAQAQAQAPEKSSVMMARSEHAWNGGGKSSTFDVHWQNGELKMIREELAPSSGVIEKNEFVFNAGVLLHFKQDRYPVPGKSGDAVALMVSFDKSGNPLVSMKRVGGKPVGAASPAEIAQARKHLAELQAIAMKAKP
jgi:hypothetical protein